MALRFGLAAEDKKEVLPGCSVVVRAGDPATSKTTAVVGLSVAWMAGMKALDARLADPG